MESKEKPRVWLDLDATNDNERVEAPHFLEAHARLIACRVAELLREQQATIIPEYITAEEAARMIRVPVRTLQNWRARDDGPPFMRFGQTIRYRVADLREWMEKRRVEPE